MPEAWDYEQAVAQIEAIIAQIESGSLSLTEVFAQFEVATTNLARCDAFLKEHRTQADLRIEQLQGNALPPKATSELTEESAAVDDDVPF